MQLRWGICGCGLIGGDFVNALSFLPKDEHKVVAVAASSEERAKDFAKKYNIEGAQCFGSYDDLNGNSEIDIIYVNVINRYHYDISMKALKSGKNVLCEPPLGLDAKQVKDMVNCARENKCFLAEAFWLRFYPVYQQIGKEIESGSIGDVKFLMANFGFFIPDEHIGYMVKQKNGGLLFVTGMSVIQMAQFVFGGKPIKIHVEGSTHEATGADVSGAITLVYPDNRIAQLLYSGAAACQNDAQIVGTKGRLMIPSVPCPTVLKKQTMGKEEAETFSYELPKVKEGGIQFNYANSQCLLYEAQCIRECIMNGLTECPRMSLDDSVMMSEILDECRKQLGVK